jgi:hypothetical protein
MPIAEGRFLVQPPTALPRKTAGAYRRATKLPGMHDLNESDVNICPLGC